MRERSEPLEILELPFPNGETFPLNLFDLRNSNVSVKGSTYREVARFAKIYAGHSFGEFGVSGIAEKARKARESLATASWDQLKALFFPRISGRPVLIGADIAQPPTSPGSTQGRVLASTNHQ